MLKFQNFGRPPSQPRLPAPFFQAVGQKSKFRSERIVSLIVPIPKSCDTTPLPQNPRGDRFGRNPLLQGPGLTPRAAGSESPARKLLPSPVNFALFRPTSQKLWHFFKVTDTQAPRHPDKNESRHYHYRILFYMYLRGKEGNSTNPSKFLPLHFVKDNQKPLHLICLFH